MAIIKTGTTFSHKSASGTARYRVLRPHRDAGFYETALVEWTDGYGAQALQSLRGSIQVFPREEIEKAA